MLDNFFSDSHHVGIFTHVNPDGDALGSSTGLKAYLESRRIQCKLFLPTPYGESLDFIQSDEDRADTIIGNRMNAGELQDLVDSCDLLVGLDFNVMDRIGCNASPFIMSKARKLLIDHHVGPQKEYFDEVYSCTEVSSTCELLYRLLLKLPDIGGDPSKLTDKSRRALLTGMTTDTNNFANSVFPSTLEMASEIIAAGTDRDSIINELYFSYPERRLRALGYILEKLLVITPQGVGYVVMDWKTQESFGMQEGDSEGFVNYALSINAVKMSILLKEESDGKKIRVSIRSKKGVSARECAMRYFNGGGHELASGGKLYTGVDIPDVSCAASYIEKVTKEFFAG